MAAGGLGAGTTENGEKIFKIALKIHKNGQNLKKVLRKYGCVVIGLAIWLLGDITISVTKAIGSGRAVAISATQAAGTKNKIK